MSNSTQSSSVLEDLSGFIYGLVADSYYTSIANAISLKYELDNLFTDFKKTDLQGTRKGDVAVMTGGSAGIGYEVIKKLLKADFHVIIGIRNLERGKETKDKILKEGITSGKLQCLELDLMSLESVRKFCQLVLAKTNKIHILINNAGIMMVPYSITENNMESQFQVNYLSHFLITNLLLPVIIKTGSDSEKCCRIVNTSSMVHFGGSMNFEDLQKIKWYSSQKAYFDSKLAQVLSTKYLDRMMVEAKNKVRVYAVHPGAIPTGLWDSSIVLKMAKPLARLISPTAEDGAEAIIFAALSPDVEDKGGIFLSKNKEYAFNHKADDVAAQEKLWNVSISLAEIDDNSN